MSFLQILVAVLFVGAAVAVTFWNEILNWASKTLFPWIKKYLPDLESYVKDAFAKLDEVVTPIRNKIKALKKLTEIKEAWKMLREYLLQVLVQFEQKTPNEWVKRITCWAINNLESKQVLRTVLEEKVDADSLPPDVRKEWLKQNNTTQDINVTQVRDDEMRERKLDELVMTN